MKNLFHPFSCALAILTAALTSTHAATFVVRTLADSGAGSLRQAMLAANDTAGDDLITNAVTGTIKLRSPLPTLTDNTAIHGRGTNLLTISGSNAFRVFTMAANTTNTLRGLTVAFGRATNQNGAGLSSAGELVLINCAVVSNLTVGGLGGGVYHSGRLRATNTVFAGNSVRGTAGESRDALTSGGGGGGGGGLGGAVYGAGWNEFGDCRFLGNTAVGGDGGGGGANQPDGRGGNGGGLYGGAGATDATTHGAPGGGYGGGGGGGVGDGDGPRFGNGGTGGFGGGGGGGGASTGGGDGGSGGASHYGGRGGQARYSFAGGGGGGAGLGGAIFVPRGGVVQFFDHCLLAQNAATNGAGGFGSFGFGNGVDGAGAGGAVFIESYGAFGSRSLAFSNNFASTAYPDVAEGSVLVTTLADSGPGTLREALNAAASGSTILFDVTGQVTLLSPLPALDADLFINGPGAEQLTVSGNNAVRVFQVSSGRTVSLRALTVAQGSATDELGGGGVFNDGALTVADCVVANNQAIGFGGGLHSAARLTVSRTAFTGNVARGGDGESRNSAGLSNSGGGGGGGAGLGGGLHVSGEATLKNCSFSGNQAIGGNGGQGGENGDTYTGGNGGRPNAGLGGGFATGGLDGGFGGGGGGGGGSDIVESDPPTSPGGRGGFGGGGGGAGASRFGGSGGAGGAGKFGGGGGTSCCLYAGGGGGGAGLGGAIFSLAYYLEASNCSFTDNIAANGIGGAGSFDLGNGTNGTGYGAALFDNTHTATLIKPSFAGNISSSSGSEAYQFPTQLPVVTPALQVVTNPPGTVMFHVTASGPGPSSYRWRRNEAVITNENVTGNLTDTLTITDPRPANAGVYTVDVTTPFGTAASSPGILTVKAAGSPDTNKPTLAITAPLAASLRVSSNSINLRGTARDNTGVYCVFVQSGASPLRRTDGTTNWLFQVPLAPGTNRLRVFAVDSFGNVSATNNRVVFYATSNRLSLAIAGNGRVLPNLHNQNLEVGRSYRMTATPGAGYVFSNWLGGAYCPTDALTNTSPLSFLMQSNLALQANFVPNPFLARKGVYNGLFVEPLTPRNDASGFLTASATELGAYSGALLTAGKRYPLSGKFDLNGLATNFVPRPGANTLRVELRLPLTGNGDQITGLVTDGSWSASLRADRAVFHAVTNRFAGAGKFTFYAEGGVNPAASPIGYSIGAAPVDAAGVLNFSGTLSDGTPAVQRVPLAQNGDWPLYVSLYGGKGAFVGWLNVNTNTPDALSGRLGWIKESVSGGQYYPAGFTNSPRAFGSIYKSPTTNRVIDVTAAYVYFYRDNVSFWFRNEVGLTPNNQIVNLSFNPLTMPITLANGLFSGTVTPPTGGPPIAFKGVLDQTMRDGVGFFLGTNQTGRVEFNDF